MKCSLAKWYISSVADNGKRLPAFVSAHIAGCESCSEFAKFCDHLDHSLAKKQSQPGASGLRVITSPSFRMEWKRLASAGVAIAAGLMIICIIAAVKFTVSDADPIEMATTTSVVGTETFDVANSNMAALSSLALTYSQTQTDRLHDEAVFFIEDLSRVCSLALTLGADEDDTEIGDS